MSAVIRLPAPLRPYADGQAEVVVAVGTAGGALRELVERYPLLRRHLFADDGELRAFVNVFVNEDDIRHVAGEATAVEPGDVVLIVPSIAGGGGQWSVVSGQ